MTDSSSAAAAARGDLFAWLLAPRERELVGMPSLQVCWETLERLDAELAGSIDRAAAGGFASDRLGHAFVAGYRAALACLAPTLHLGLSRASLCATEEGGAHPRAIQTTLTPALVLTGHKTFATLASQARTLLVVASTGRGEDGRNRLRVVAIPASRAGVSIEDHAPLAFAPEIPHARVTFDAVQVAPDELLPGDGYDVVLKPFRTLEDEHVMAALLGHLVRLVRSSPAHRATLEAALASLAALRDCAARDPSDPATHLVLAGILDGAARLAGGFPVELMDAPARARWERDLPLLAVAAGARGARREAAYRRLAELESRR